MNVNLFRHQKDPETQRGKATPSDLKPAAQLGLVLVHPSTAAATTATTFATTKHQVTCVVIHLKHRKQSTDITQNLPNRGAVIGPSQRTTFGSVT